MTVPGATGGDDQAQPSSAREPLAPQRLARALAALGLGRFSGIYLWGAIVLIFALWIPSTFLTSTTARSIGAGQAVVAVVALAALFTLVVGEYDLSVAQNMGACALTAGYLMTNSGRSPAVAVTAALLLGAAVGVVNGLLVAVVGMSSFIATLGMTSVLLAGQEAIAAGQ